MSGVCDIPVLATVCQTAGQAAGSLVEAPFDWLAKAAGNSAQWMFQSVWSVFDTTTLVDVTSDNYLKVYNVLFGIAIFIMLIFFCLQLITGLIRRDPGALHRAALGLAKSVLGSFLVITLTATLLQVVDQLCVGIVSATGTTLDEMGAKIGALTVGLGSISVPSPGVGAIITIFLSFLAIAAAAIVWFSLLVRKALLLVGIVLAPIALSGSVWDATKGWVGKWAAFVIALIVSKLVIVVVFLVAINQLNAPINFDLASISDPIAGIVLMFVAAFAPYMAYKFVSFIGFDIYHAMSTEQEAKQAMNRPIPVPGKPSGDAAKKVLDGASGKGGGGAPPPGPTAGGATAAGGGEAGAAAGAGGGGAGAGAGGGGAAAGAGAAAAGPAAAAVIGAEALKAAATAGPKAGAAVGGAADQHITASQQPLTPTSTAGTAPPIAAGKPASPTAQV
ncbi:conjugal transfer protein TrbL [Lacisediminihabitans sp. H27-G8]|uniref:conjugal transfer protein TrbL n=1 Tax=Lacisediminihabitans sp. H27-G8 TaxID=3111909 RepID=UPI0038FD16AD